MKEKLKQIRNELEAVQYVLHDLIEDVDALIEETENQEDDLK